MSESLAVSYPPAWKTGGKVSYSGRTRGSAPARLADLRRLALIASKAAARQVRPR